MSTISIDQYNIIGTPEAAKQEVINVAYFLATNSGYSPSDEFFADMDKLAEEIIEVHTYDDEGFFIFESDLVDDVLNRAYPYLVQHTLDHDVKIDLTRTEEVTEDEDIIIIYGVEVSPNEGEKPNPIEGDEANISENPFQRSPGIGNPAIPNPLGTPAEGAYPRYDGIPYNPLDPTSRDLQPLVPRTPQQIIEDTTQQPVRISPPTISGGILDLPDDSTDDELPPLPDNEDEDESEDNDETKDEAELEETNKGILQKILEAIIDQGNKTRQSIADLGYAIDVQLSEVESSIDEIIPGFEDAITAIFFESEATSDWLEGETRQIINDMFNKAIELSDALQQGTQDAIDKIFDEIVATVDDPKGAIDKAIDTAGELISDGLSFGYHLIADAIGDTTKMIKWLGETYLEGVSQTTGFLANTLDMDMDDLTDWICQFFKQITEIKNKCDIFQEGNL